MKTEMKHSLSKSKHKYFGLGRITSTFGVFALVALVCVSMSGTASGGNNGVPFQIETLTNQIAVLEGKIDALSTSTSGGTVSILNDIASAKDAIITNTDLEVGNAKSEIITNTDAESDEILAFIRATHMVDAFDVAVNICTEIEGGAAIEGMANLGIGAYLEAHLGVDFYGSGAQIGIQPAGEIGAGLNIRSDVETYVTACINGIFTRQTPDTTEEAAIIASGRDATEIALLTELIETGHRYSNRIAVSANDMKLVETSPNPASDRMNNSLDAYEAFSTLNLQKIAAIIVNTGKPGASNDTALDDFAGSMPSFGLGGLFSSTGLPSVVSLGSGNITSIGNSIASGLSTLGLGSVGGLSGLTSGLSGFTDLKTAFEGIPAAFETLGTALSDITTAVGGVFSGGGSGGDDIGDVLCGIFGC